MQKGKRFLHLMMDEKFIDYFIEQSEKVANGESEYWVIKDEEKVSLKSTNSNVTSITWSSSTIHNLALKANHYERLIVHSYFFPHLDKFFKILSKDIPVVWVFWGGDGYSFTVDTKRWFLPLTWRWKNNTRTSNVSFLRGWVRKGLLYKHDILKSLYTRKLIKRANFCATWVTYDYDMVRHINPKMEFLFYSYFTSNQMAFSSLQKVDPNFNRIWLGNSATDTNNHLDALQYLFQIQWKGEIIVPLSYGSKDYANYIIQFGKNLFGDRFIPIQNLLPLNEYQELMNSCGIVWMNHVRQQAAGNVIAALHMGKAVILNENNNLFKTLKDWGIVFLEKNDINKLRIDNIDFKINSEIIENYFSEEQNLVAVKNMYQEHHSK